MARPKKEGLDYFPLDCGFLMDPDIRAIRGKFGNDAIAVYLYIVSEAYHRNGFFLTLDDEIIELISTDMQVAEEKTRQIVDSLLRRSLLTKVSTLAGAAALTSPGIQRRFQAIIKTRKRTVNVDRSVWLLEAGETDECVQVCLPEGFSRENPGFSEKNPSFSRENAVNKSKVNKNKKNHNNTASRPTDDFAPLVSIYGEEAVEKARHKAAERGVRRLAYIEKILQNEAKPITQPSDYEGSFY